MNIFIIGFVVGLCGFLAGYLLTLWVGTKWFMR